MLLGARAFASSLARLFAALLPILKFVFVNLDAQFHDPRLHSSLKASILSA
jgi:hypothetical protein